MKESAGGTKTCWQRNLTAHCIQVACEEMLENWVHARICWQRNLRLIVFKLHVRKLKKETGFKEALRWSLTKLSTIFSKNGEQAILFLHCTQLMLLNQWPELTRRWDKAISTLSADPTDVAEPNIYVTSKIVILIRPWLQQKHSWARMLGRSTLQVSSNTRNTLIFWQTWWETFLNTSHPYCTHPYSSSVPKKWRFRIQNLSQKEWCFA
jgi:hypothetical protein